MKNISGVLSILIPMYNEGVDIRNTLTELVCRDLHERYKIVICDDDSADHSLAEAQSIAQTHRNIVLVENRPNGKKIGAIKTGLLSVTTPYVLLLDADSGIIEITQCYLDALVTKMQDQGITAIGFKIRPPATSLLEYLQTLEYLLFTDGLRRLLGIPVCLVGIGALWKVDDLKAILARHSGTFEGDDLEITILATMLSFKIVYEAHGIFVTTKLKRNLGELIRQRAYIWDVGLIRTLLDTRSILNVNWTGQDAAFFRGVFITEVVAHPFKILSLAGLLLVALSILLGSLDFAPLLPKQTGNTSEYVLAVLTSTHCVYLLLWAINVVSICLSMKSRLRSVPLFILYFTFYMATPIVSSVTSDFGQLLGFTYLWWYALCAFLIMLGTESPETKIRSLVLALLMPLYFALLFALPRTVGFVRYILGRMQGKYSKLKEVRRSPLK